MTSMDEMKTARENSKLIKMIDEAVSLSDVESTVDELKTQLCRLIRSGAVELPEEFLQPKPDCYARRLLHRNDDLGYSVVVMTWEPGQATGIHDHASMWCVEGVYQGLIDVDQYELTENRGNEFKFEKRNSYAAGTGSAGCLIPPFEYHRIANRDAESVAVTIHVYGGDMTFCHVYEDSEAGWYVQRERRLSFD